MKTIIILLALTGVASAQVRHVPPSEAEAGKDVSLIADAPSTTPTLVVHVRPHGTQDPFAAIELVRKDDRSWVAVIAAARVVPPGLDYYITAGDDVVFASAEWPHSIAIHAAPDDERRVRDDIRARGRRSRTHVMGEWVDFGGKSPGMPKATDHYYRFDADFGYRLWTYPLEEIRVGYTRLLGDTLQSPDKPCPMAPCTQDAGFKVAGWFELGLAAVEGVRFDARMSVMATQDGFAVGGRGEARLGDRDASHVAVGVEYLATVGTSGYFRLGWGTVPKLPMAATVEITNLPADYRETGVRLYYDVGRDIASGVRVGIRAGYAARNQAYAGFTGGAGATVEF